ncbi:TetR/AcrR family transcriptional regulator [Microbacterium sp. zg.Y625]|uniref:TetR/AcrR family transcriptional regulator n=1 Tax=Microbacterium jiangjiandongii TaxID=3049071 RepID=UPI00214C9286|nr:MULTISPECIES: TetR/AcrR family transcriptional regulator [unclassified Microbacterium]MCR2792742.1 TetR/AcrR family transcriptional regulator [Microbacterium sp. zg.Y625]WIM26720.1 TetR/AcrR family transcriptional regulator [Microbacterium sp. zg-Y625]
MSTRAERGPYAKSAQRRAVIARAALAVIEEWGHIELTMSQVAAVAGLSERSLFYHFPTRDHVLVAALELSDTLTTDDVGSRDDSQLGDADQVVSVLARLDAQHEWKVRLVVYLSARAQEPEHPAHAYFMTHNAAAIQGFANMLRHRQHRGLAHPDLEPEAVARRFVALWDGLQALWLVSPTFDLADEILASFRQLSGQNVMEAKRAFERAIAES